MSLQPYDWQEKDPNLFAFEAPRPIELEYDPYNIATVVDSIRPDIDEARIAMGYSGEWTHAMKVDYIEAEPMPFTIPSRIGFGAISLYEQSTEFDNIEDFIKDLADRRSVDGEALLKDVSKFMTRRGAMEKHSSKITEAIEAEIGDDVDKAYILTKFLSSHPADIANDYHAVLGQDLLVLGSEFDATDLGTISKVNIREHVFDSHIARDLLYRNRREVQEVKPSSLASCLSKMIDMAKYHLQTDNDHQAIDSLTSAEAMQHWQPEARKQFLQAKENLEKGITERYEARRSIAYGIGVLIKPIKEEEFASLCNQALGFQKGKVRSDGRQTRVEEIQSNIKKRKTGNSKKIGAIAKKGSNSPDRDGTAEKVKQKTLQFVNLYGETFPEESDEFKKIIREYLSGHLEDIDSFKQDLRKSLDYLRDPVKTNGYARGIQPLKSRNAIFTMEDGTRKKIQRFRPGMGTGVSLACKFSQKTRILFVEHEGAVNILGIADKDDISKLLQKFGVNTKDRNG